MSRRSSIRARLLLLTLAVGAPLLGLFLFTFESSKQEDLRKAGEATLALSRLASADLAQFLRESEEIVRQLALRPGFRDTTSVGGCDPIVTDFEKLHPWYANLIITNATGQVVCSAVDPQTGVLPSVADSPWFAIVRDDRRIVLSPPSLGRITGSPVSVIAGPILDERGSFAGSVAISIDLVRHEQVLNRVSLPANGMLVIMDAAGTIAAHSSLFGWLGRNARGYEIVDHVLAHPEGTIQARGLDGVEKIYGYTTVPTYGWHVYAGIPTEVALRSTRAHAARLAILGLIVLFIVAVISTFLARQIERPIGALANAASEVSRGDTSARAPLGGPREIAEVASQFNQMLEILGKKEQELIRSRENLRALSSRLFTVQEQERTRIAREIHDHLGQILTSLKLDLDWFARHALVSDTRRIAQMVQMADEAIVALRDIAMELRPSTLDNLGLTAAIEAEVSLFEQRTGIACDLSILPESLELDRDRSTALFRILQEILTNVARHAGASEVEIMLRQNDGEVVLEVRDNGCGITHSAVEEPSSLGLTGIRERVTFFGGNAQFHRIDGSGTVVTVRIPLATAPLQVAHG